MSHVHGLGQGDAVLMPAPLAHISGLLNAVLVPGAAGMKVVLMERWSVDEGLELMASEAVTYMIGPPLMFDAIMDAASFSREKVAAMRVISSGMMGVRPTFIERAHREMGAVVKRSYGSTEAPTVSTPPKSKWSTPLRIACESPALKARCGFEDQSCLLATLMSKKREMRFIVDGFEVVTLECCAMDGLS
jgi:acyl-CoA synthetase (AMP-forming)/AMP-acid ligase II